jgi:hypothetical protein
MFMPKDWTGNTNSIFKTHGASNHSSVIREENDFYASPPCAVRTLLDYCINNGIDVTNKPILEPCCGKGHISEVCKQYGFTVDSRDLINRGYGERFENFLENQETNIDKHIITNPPYKYAKEFVEHSIGMLNEGNYICMLLKITFLEGTKRQTMFKKNPPYKVLVFSDRINCSLGGDFENDSEYNGAVCYAWFIWKVGYNGLTTIDWINAK